MSSPSISNTEPPAYLGFYGLQTSPFSLAPRPRFTFPARAYSRALVELTEALRRREGLTVVIGESGTGKTMLVRTVLQQYDRPLFLSMVVNPFLSAGDLMWQVLSDFGVLAQLGPNEGPLASSSVNDLLVVLERFLSTRMQADARAIVAIDDAHQLHSRVFEELRALSNLEANGTKLLQIVLIGQKQLDVLFRKPEGRQIEQRVTRRCVLEPLTRPEVGEYVAHRLTAARDRDLFVDGSYNLRMEGDSR